MFGVQRSDFWTPVESIGLPQPELACPERSRRDAEGTPEGRRNAAILAVQLQKAPAGSQRYSNRPRYSQGEARA